MINKQSSLSLLAAYGLLSSGGQLSKGVSALLAGNKPDAWKRILSGAFGLMLPAIPAPGGAKVISHVLADPRVWEWAGRTKLQGKL